MCWPISGLVNHIDMLLQFWWQFKRFWCLFHLLSHSLNIHMPLSSGARDKMFGLNFHLCQLILFMCSFETAQICRLSELSQIAYAISTKSLEVAHYILVINVGHSFLMMLYYRLKRLCIMPVLFRAISPGSKRFGVWVSPHTKAQRYC